LLDVEVVSSSITYQGQPVIQTVVRDITEYKKISQALQEANTKLETRVIELTTELQKVNECLIALYNIGQLIATPLKLELVQDGLSEGVIAVLNKPLNISQPLNFLSLLSQEHAVVVVDGDPNFCQTLGNILQAKGYAVTSMTDPEGLMEKLADQGQTVLLDMKLRNSTGLDVLRQIRQKYPALDVVIITGYPEEYEPAVKIALEISAYTCFYKPLQIEPLLQTLDQLHRRELSRMLGQPHPKKR
jgi:CheY-like chemotaxis protein